MTGGSLLSYVALAPGAARGECLLTALALLGSPVRDHRIVTCAPVPTTWTGPRQLARMVLVEPRGRVEPLAERLRAGAWTWQASAAGGVEHGLLQREGPGDPELARALAAELGCDVAAVSCADGGAVRWLHVTAAGEETAGEGRGRRAAAAAWAHPAGSLD